MSSTCFEHPSVHPQEDLYMQFCGISLILILITLIPQTCMYKSSWGWTFGCSKHVEDTIIKLKLCRSQWPRGLRRRSTTARLLGLWVRIPPEAWIFVCCMCFVLSGRGLCDELITRPEESYRLWCVVCDLENLTNEGTIPNQCDWV